MPPTAAPSTVRARLDAQLREMLTRSSGEAAASAVDGASLDTGVQRLIRHRSAQILASLAGVLDELPDDDTTTTVYDLLLQFLSRYFDRGDFVVTPLGSSSTPYYTPAGSPFDDAGPVPLAAHRGEDVTFTWRGRGAHYIKSASTFAEVTFVDDTDDQQVTFQLRSVTATRGDSKTVADTEGDYLDKGALFHVPQLEDARRLDDGRLLVPVDLRPVHVEEDLVPGASAKGTVSAANAKQFRAACLSADRLDKAGLPPELSDRLVGYLEQVVAGVEQEFFLQPHLAAFLTAELHRFVIEELLGGATLAALTDTTAELGRRLVDAGTTLIAALAGVEHHLSALFEKRRFVLRSRWLLPARLLDDVVLAEAINSDDQRAAWLDLFRVEVSSDTEAASVRAEHPTLLVDTSKVTAPTFADRAVESARSALEREAGRFVSVDEMTDGVLVNGENYGALRTLEARYAGQADVVYLDPPYNTGQDGFQYKDAFSKESSWLTFMEERLRLGRELLKATGWMGVSIDEYQHHSLRMLLRDLFKAHGATPEIVRKTGSPKGQGLSTHHDYLLLAGGTPVRGEPKTPRDYSNPDDDPRGPWQSVDLARAETWRTRPKSYYPVFDNASRIAYPANHGRVWAFTPSCEWCGDEAELCVNERNKKDGKSCMLHRDLTGRLLKPTFDDESLEAFRAAVPTSYPKAPGARLQAAGATPGGFVVVNAPVDDHKRWFDDGIVLVEADGELYEVPHADLDSCRMGDRPKHALPRRKSFFDELQETHDAVPSLWTKDGESSVSNDRGTKRLGRLLEPELREGTTPKPVELVDRLVRYTELAGPMLEDPEHPRGAREDVTGGCKTLVVDYFGGSGTTGDAVIQLVRNDGRRRQFLLVEMGAYFETTMLRRVARVAYSGTWSKGGREVTPPAGDDVERSPRAIQVLELEDFEDSLAALTVDASAADVTVPVGVIQYLLDADASTALQLRALLAEPSTATLRGAANDQPVDVAATWELLTGARHQRTLAFTRTDDHAGDVTYTFVESTRNAQPSVTVWRDVPDGCTPEWLTRESDWLDARLDELVREPNTIQGTVGWRTHFTGGVFVNSDSVLGGVRTVDEQFRSLMMQREMGR